MDTIRIYIAGDDGPDRELEIPVGISMSLMEALKAYEEPIEATCGGMALCASCLVEVLDGLEATGDTTVDEEAMLDTLPEYEPNFRLACQIRVSPAIKGLRIRYRFAGVQG